MSAQKHPIRDRIERFFAYPAPAAEPIDPRGQRAAAREAWELKEELAEETGAEAGSS